MKRPDPVMHHLIAAMLYAWSLVAVNTAWHSTSLAAWMTATAVCYLTAIALFQALQASWRAWRGRKVTPPPAATAPLWPTSTTDAVFEAYDAERAEQQHAEAIAAVAADTPLPKRPTTVDATAVMPTVTADAPWAHKVAQPSGLPWTAPGRHGREDVRETVGVGR